MSIKTKPHDDERCDGCGRKLGNINAHHIWDGTRTLRYHPGHCPGENCTTKESTHNG